MPFFQGIHKHAQVPVRWGNQRGGPPHDVVAGKDRPAGFMGEPQMVGEMTGGVDGADGANFQINDLPVSQDLVRLKVGINPFCPAQSALPCEPVHQRGAGRISRAKSVDWHAMFGAETA